MGARMQHTQGFNLCTGPMACVDPEPLNEVEKAGFKAGQWLHCPSAVMHSNALPSMQAQMLTTCTAMQRHMQPARPTV
jgi:hypothetical protein